MLFQKFCSLILFLMILFAVSKPVAASCGTCIIPRLGKEDTAVRAESGDKKWYFEYLFEQKVWDEMDARDAHNLHHQGHHFHDKTTEDFHHFSLGRKVLEDLTFFIEIPYVIRRSLEVDSHSILGSKQSSEGWGDTHLIGDYRFWKSDDQSLSLTGGVKFPTGKTKEKNSIGTLFEPELQPGTGSFDYILGTVYKRDMGRFSLIGNATHVFNTEGDYNFTFGDVSSVSLYVDYLFNPQSETMKKKVGLDVVYQYEQKQKDDGVKVADSGGQTILLGPVLKSEVNSRVSFFSSFLYPVVQNLGGVHQELDFEWTAGGKILW